jgi:hypothetical protein
MKKLVILTTIMALFFSSCAKNTTTELTAEQKATIEKEVLNQYNKNVSAIGQLSFDLWSEFISKDEFISHISGTRGITYGYSAWADSIKVSFGRRTRHQTQQLDVKITVLNPDLALVTSVAIWENWYQNGRYRKSNGKATYLYKKEQDGWKYIHVHESTLLLEETSAK